MKQMSQVPQLTLMLSAFDQPYEHKGPTATVRSIGHAAPTTNYARNEPPFLPSS